MIVDAVLRIAEIKQAYRIGEMFMFVSMPGTPLRRVSHSVFIDVAGEQVAENRLVVVHRIVFVSNDAESALYPFAAIFGKGDRVAGDDFYRSAFYGGIGSPRNGDLLRPGR